jgi:hypothetical protein
MHTEFVKIYSDQTDTAVMRHPGPIFLGVLVQGDTLYPRCVSADAACVQARGLIGDEGFDELNELRNELWSLLALQDCACRTQHSTSVLGNPCDVICSNNFRQAGLMVRLY